MNTIRTILLVALAALSCAGYAQDYEQQAQQAFSSGDPYAMKELLDNHGDKLSPLATVMLKSITGFAFNKNEQTVGAVVEIMNKYQNELDAPTIFSLVYLLGRCNDVMGKHKENAEMLGSFVQSVKGVEGIPEDAYEGHEKCFITSSILADCPTITIERHGNGAFPFVRDTVGPKRNVSLRADALINGKYNSPVLDTGAAMCIITPEAAERYGLKLIDANLVINAAKAEVAKYALCDELVIGDITLHNVLFAVMNFKAGHPEAEQYLNFDAVIGLNVLQEMGEIAIDFEKDVITMPVEPVTFGPSNITRSVNALTFNLRAFHEDEPLDLLVDTGNSDYAFLGSDYYVKHKDWIEANADTVTFRQAGLNGVIIGTKYKLKDFGMSMDGRSVTIPEVIVASSDKVESLEENNMGLPAMALFKRVIINFRDAYMKFED